MYVCHWTSDRGIYSYCGSFEAVVTVNSYLAQYRVNGDDDDDDDDA